jgi:hypothetical protein
MLNTTEKLLEKGYKDQPFKEWEFASIFDGSDARRWGLMNKALKKREIIQLYRGVYILGPKYRSPTPSKFFMASQLVSNSYISFETALSFHNWIPERVTVVMSAITHKRTKHFITPLGEFSYFNIPVNEYEFLTGIERIEIAGKPFLMATPLRALGDYVYINKIEWQGLDFLLEGLRIEKEDLEQITSKNFEELLSVFHSKRVLYFLKKLREALHK